MKTSMPINEIFMEYQRQQEKKIIFVSCLFLLYLYTFFIDFYYKLYYYTLSLYIYSLRKTSKIEIKWG